MDGLCYKYVLWLWLIRWLLPVELTKRMITYLKKKVRHNETCRWRPLEKRAAVCSWPLVRRVTLINSSVRMCNNKVINRGSHKTGLSLTVFFASFFLQKKVLSFWMFHHELPSLVFFFGCWLCLFLACCLYEVGEGGGGDGFHFDSGLDLTVIFKNTREQIVWGTPELEAFDLLDVI